MYGRTDAYFEYGHRARPRDRAAISLVTALDLLSAAPFWWQYLPGQGKPEVAWPAEPDEPDEPDGLANPGVIGFTDGCAPFIVVPQNRWLPYGAVVRTAPPDRQADRWPGSEPSDCRRRVGSLGSALPGQPGTLEQRHLVPPVRRRGLGVLRRRSRRADLPGPNPSGPGRRSTRSYRPSLPGVSPVGTRRAPVRRPWGTV